MGTCVYAKKVTHTDTNTRIKTGVMAIGKICKADLPKNENESEFGGIATDDDRLYFPKFGSVIQVFQVEWKSTIVADL